MIFAPSWLESTFHKSSNKTTLQRKKKIFLEITEKPKLFKLNLNNFSFRPNYTKTKNITINYCKNRHEKMMKYCLLDERKYYFTPKDYDNYLKYNNFNIEVCRINSPYFKNNISVAEIKNNILYKKLNESKEYYFSCINHVDNLEYIPDINDYEYDYSTLTDYDSDSDEFEVY